MNINISTKNFELSQATKDMITTSIDKKLSSLTDEVDAVVIQEGRRIIVKLKTIAYDTKINATGDDLRLTTALAEAMDIMKRKVRKAKTQSSKIGSAVKQHYETDYQDDLFIRTAAISDTKHIVIDTLSDDEAVYRANMQDMNVFHYRDAAGCMAVLIKQNRSFLKLTVE